MSRHILKNSAAGLPLVLTLCTLTPIAAHAQQANAPAAAGPSAPVQQVGEVVVTAERREQSLQKVPVAVTALSGSEIAKAGVADITELKNTIPNLVISGNNQQGETPIAIRGISGSTAGIGSENPVAVYIDGVYIGASSAQVFAFADLDRVEVLRGPQGTLYGRNATGGAIGVFTRQPTASLQGEVSADYGSFDTARANGWVSGPVTDKLQFETSAYFDHTDGWEENLYNGRYVNGATDYGVRGALKYLATDSLAVTLNFDVGHQEDPAAFHSESPGPFSWNHVDVNEDVKSLRDLGGTSVTVKYVMPLATLTSITAYRQVSVNYNSDSDALPKQIYQSPIFINQSQESEELRLASNTEGPVSWIAGFFYFHEFATLGYDPVHLGAVYAIDNANATTDSYAGYIQADYHPIRKLTLTAGLRYTEDVKSYFISNSFPNALGQPTIPPSNENGDFGAVTPRFAANYQLTDTAMLYASATRGFRAGGFNLASDYGAFKPEYIWSYEAGVKTDLFDHRLRLDLTGFHYDYSNLQVRQLPAPGVSVVLNAASAEADGVELESTWIPITGLRLTADASYLDAHYVKFTENGESLDGNALNHAPRFTGSVSADYTWDVSRVGRFDVTGTLGGQSKEYFNEFNVPRLEGKGYIDLDGRIGYQPPGDYGLSISLIAKNLLNERHLTNGLQLASIYYDVTVNEPRSLMVELRQKF